MAILALLAVGALAGCAETKFIPPSADLRQQLGKTAVVALPSLGQPQIDRPVSGSGSGALMGAGEGASGGLAIAGGGCEGGPDSCALGIILGAAVAIVAAPMGAVAGAINAHSDQEVAIADSSLRAAFADINASEMLRDRVVSAARTATHYDLAILSPPARADLKHDLPTAGYASELEVKVTDLGLSLAGRIDPDATLYIVAEARLRRAANGSELYVRKWAYFGVSRNYFKLAAGNAEMLRSQLRAALAQIGDRVVTDLLVSNAPEVKQTSPSPGSVITIEGPTLESVSPANAAASSAPASTAATATAAVPSSRASMEVPFSVELAGQSYEGVAKLKQGHLDGRLEALAKPVTLSAEIVGNTVRARLVGALDPREGSYGTACVADGEASPANGPVTIPMTANCTIYNPKVVLHLDMPAAAGS